MHKVKSCRHINERVVRSAFTRACDRLTIMGVNSSPQAHAPVLRSSCITHKGEERRITPHPRPLLQHPHNHQSHLQTFCSSWVLPFLQDSWKTSSLPDALPRHPHRLLPLP